MASACSRFIRKTSLNSIKTALKSNCPKSIPIRSASLPTKPAAAPLRRFSFRCPSELGCAQSLLPLHSAVAAARMTSCLSTTSRSCRALSQDAIDGT